MAPKWGGAAPRYMPGRARIESSQCISEALFADRFRARGRDRAGKPRACGVGGGGLKKQSRTRALRAGG